MIIYSVQNLRRGVQWTHVRVCCCDDAHFAGSESATWSVLLLLSFALACSFESVFFLNIWDIATQTVPQTYVEYCRPRYVKLHSLH